MVRFEFVRPEGEKNQPGILLIPRASIRSIRSSPYDSSFVRVHVSYLDEDTNGYMSHKDFREIETALPEPLHPQPTPMTEEEKQRLALAVQRHIESHKALEQAARRQCATKFMAWLDDTGRKIFRDDPAGTGVQIREQIGLLAEEYASAPQPST